MRLTWFYRMTPADFWWYIATAAALGAVTTYAIASARRWHTNRKTRNTQSRIRSTPLSREPWQ